MAEDCLYVNVANASLDLSVGAVDAGAVGNVDAAAVDAAAVDAAAVDAAAVDADKRPVASHNPASQYPVSPNHPESHGSAMPDSCVATNFLTFHDLPWPRYHSNEVAGLQMVMALRTPVLTLVRG